MNFNWHIRKKIFDPSEFENWGKTHAQVPYYFDSGVDKFIYFTSRPPKNNDGSYVSHVHSLTVDINKGDISIIKLNKEPLLPLGKLGAFDETGTMPCSVIKNEATGEVWMYYVGWNRKFNVPYDCAVGLAISKDNGHTFSKYFEGPIMGQNINDPFLVGCPRVYKFDNLWYMFYLAGIKWVKYGDKVESHYRIKIAKSKDGINWNRNDLFVIPELYEMESQTCPSIIFLNGNYHMFFTYRHTVDFRNPQRGYRIGYAVSSDLEKWVRDDARGNFWVSKEGWDSEMVCYPNLNNIQNKLMMFYCGNQFGLRGFGYSINSEL